VVCELAETLFAVGELLLGNNPLGHLLHHSYHTAGTGDLEVNPAPRLHPPGESIDPVDHSVKGGKDVIATRVEGPVDRLLGTRMVIRMNLGEERCDLHRSGRFDSPQLVGAFIPAQGVGLNVPVEGAQPRGLLCEE
jgi:hypothetical protein